MFARKITTPSLVLVLGLLGACSKNFVVSEDFPSPLVPRADTRVLMKYSDKFANYEFTEKAKERPLERVAIGPAQVNLFNQVFGAMFDLVPEGSQSVALTVEPEILDLQYSAPSETKLNLYEVWLKYRIKVSDAEGDELADWLVKGYGKTPTASLGSYLKAFDTASTIALRDVGAQLAIGFRTQPSIEEYLANLRTGAGLVSQVTAEAELEELAEESEVVAESIIAASEEPESESSETVQAEDNETEEQE